MAFSFSSPVQIYRKGYWTTLGVSVGGCGVDVRVRKNSYIISSYRRTNHGITITYHIALYVFRGNGWIADRFNTTPIMSTYLLALIVCDFTYVSNMTENGIEVRQ